MVPICLATLVCRSKLLWPFSWWKHLHRRISGSSLPQCSLLDITMHYSFDMVQQVHYPSNPLQPGPYYFLTLRKCGIFGVCNEGIPQQVNYLIDEAVATGKGVNTIISMLHHFSTHGLGWRPPPTEFPELLPPKGLSFKRQTYLHKNIREYCPVEQQDRVCLKPIPTDSPDDKGGSSLKKQTLWLLPST